MSDFRVKITVKNNRILKRMEELGIQTQSELAAKCGLGPTILGNLLSFKRSPLGLSGFTKTAQRIADALFLAPEDLWPEHMAKLKAKSNGIEFSTDEAGIRGLQAPVEKQIDGRAMKALFDSAKLTDMERHVLADQFGLDGKDERTLTEIAGEMDRSATRAAQISQKAMRKLQRACLINKTRRIDDFYLN